MIELIRRAEGFHDNLAIISEGQKYDYSTLLGESRNVSASLLKNRADLNGQRVAFMVAPGFDYVKVQWGIWQAGGIAVPMNPGTPASALEYVIKDSLASIIIVSPLYETVLRDYAKNNAIDLFSTNQFVSEKSKLPEIKSHRSAMILYTSGTTGSPKGVVTTHANIEAQITSLIEAWQWTSADSIVNILPLHHVHGIINVVSCALWAGASCLFLPRFDAGKIFSLIKQQQINLFMAVPTIYFKLIAYWQELVDDEREIITEALGKMRLMVSGSAALPVSILENWQEISGHTLLERYGMTEIGMAISNPYTGKRKPGHIGQPLPRVEVRLADEDNNLVNAGDQGEIHVKGPAVFESYWNREKATRETFTEDGWFKTGDIAILNEGSYKILGRSSVDIIKSGGYKISALEIEEVLRTHSDVKDCGVVGIPDEEWGEIIGAGIVTSEANLDIEKLKQWVKEKLPGYKVPRKYLALVDLPRNAMGKVTKKELVEQFKLQQ
jgi:malonyl-CoA/methylmalonyl-CoA synthetase